MLTIESKANGKVSHNLDIIFRELATLRAENKRMRNRVQPARRGSAIVRRALMDAHTILMAAFSDESTGCHAMSAAHGMTRRRWEWGVAFLRYAGIVPLVNRAWRNGLQFLITDLGGAIGLLETSARELDNQDGYRRLRATLYARKM